MKKIVLSLLVVFCLNVVVYSQQVSDTQKTTKSVQTTDKSLAKKTNITPKGTTNWSKIKDLFK